MAKDEPTPDPNADATTGPASRARDTAPAPPPSSSDPAPARRARIGLFELEEELGRGGMGVVYRAWYPIQRRHVALKVLRPEVTRGEEYERLRDLFLREAGILMALSSEHVVRCIGANEAHDESGRPVLYMALELLDGEGLDERIRWEPLPVEEAIRVARGIASGLSVLHDHPQRVLHRDVKPSNVFLTSDGGVKLLDFGLAGLADWRLQVSVFAAGSRPYMAPEQFGGLRFCTERSDLYSLGITLFEMLTGVVPFEASTDRGYVRAHCGKSPPALIQKAPELAADARAEGLQRIVTKLLAKRPYERYQTAAEVVAALDCVLQGGEISRPRVSRPETRRLLRRLGAGAAGVLVVGLAAVGVRDLARGRRAPTDPPAAPRPAAATDPAAPREPGITVSGDAALEVTERAALEPSDEELARAAELDARFRGFVEAVGDGAYVIAYSFCERDAEALLGEFSGPKQGFTVDRRRGLRFEGSASEAATAYLELRSPFVAWEKSNWLGLSLDRMHPASLVISSGDDLHLGVDLASGTVAVGSELDAAAPDAIAAIGGDRRTASLPAGQGREALIDVIYGPPTLDDAPPGAEGLILFVTDQRAISVAAPRMVRPEDPIRLRVWPGGGVLELDVFGLLPAAPDPTPPAARPGR